MYLYQYHFIKACVKRHHSNFFWTLDIVICLIDNNILKDYLLILDYSTLCNIMYNYKSVKILIYPRHSTDCIFIVQRKCTY